MAFQGPLERLAAIFEQVVRSADRTVVDDREYLAALGVGAVGSVRDVWTELLAQVPVQRRDLGLWGTLERILDRGCLARRVLTALGGATEPDAIVAVYRRLAECLGRDELFEP
jgi:carboxylate-amine ligase